jgi:hypothetical protein
MLSAMVERRDNYTWTACFFLILCVCIQGRVEAIRCVRCSTENDPLCSLGFARSVQCDSLSTACLTYIGKMPSPEPDVVIRDCALNDLGNFCQTIPLLPPPPPSPDASPSSDDRQNAVDVSSSSSFEHTICIRTCRYSLCNTRPAVWKWLKQSSTSSGDRRHE